MASNDNYYDDDETDTITLTFEDGTEAECLIWGFTEVDGQTYVSLLPMEEEENEDEEGNCYVYQYDEDENGDPVLGYIEDDNLADRVVEAFERQFDEEEAEYDEIISEDELDDFDDFDDSDDYDG